MGTCVYRGVQPSHLKSYVGSKISFSTHYRRVNSEIEHCLNFFGSVCRVMDLSFSAEYLLNSFAAPRGSLAVIVFWNGLSVWLYPRGPVLGPQWEEHLVKVPFLWGSLVLSPASGHLGGNGVPAAPVSCSVPVWWMPLQGAGEFVSLFDTSLCPRQVQISPCCVQCTDMTSCDAAQAWPEG